MPERCITVTPPLHHRHSAPISERYTTVTSLLQRANPRAALVGGVGSGAMLISSPFEPLMCLRASRKPHDGAAGLVGLALGGGAVAVEQLLELGAIPLSAAFPLARPARALPRCGAHQ